MSARNLDKLPKDSVGLRLARIVNEGYVMCEAIRFSAGREAVDTVLRRAAISGRVEVGGDIVDHLADVLDDDQSIIETVALDAKSYAALKNKWMRCKVEYDDRRPPRALKGESDEGGET